jgi:hypothetical protein
MTLLLFDDSGYRHVDEFRIIAGFKCYEAGRLDEDFGRHFEEEVEIMLTVCQYIGSLRRVLTTSLRAYELRAYEL